MGWLEQFAGVPDHPLGLLILFLAAGLEYVFPPFPGDTVMLGGAILVSSKGWGFVPVFASVTAGSASGAAIDFLLGTRLHAWRRDRDGKADRAIRKILEGFRRWGIWLVAFNRFFPGVRAFFFVAAGMAGFSFWPVIGLAVVSAVAWNLLVVGAGVAVGAKLDTLGDLLATYQLAVYIVLAVALVVGAAICFGRRRRGRAVPPEEGRAGS